MPRSSTQPALTGPHGRRQANDETTTVNALDVSRYVADICGELSKMSKSAKLLMLSYLLDMAQQEAERLARDGTLMK